VSKWAGSADRSIWARIGLSFVALLAATSVVPYLFPPPADVVGLSTGDGFNNSLAFVCYIALLALAAFVVARALPLRMPGRTLELGESWSRVSWPLCVAIIAIHVLLFAGLYLYKGRFLSSEGLYFQVLLHRMTLGEIPYVDFMYYYGPGMLWPAYWLTRIIGDLEAAYAIVYVITYGVGLVLLYLLIATFVDSRRAAALWFVFLSIGLFNPMEGVNFTFVRYLLPATTLLLLARCLESGGRLRLALASVVFAFTTLYGLELGILAILGALVLIAASSLPAAVDRLLGLARLLLPGPVERPGVPDASGPAAAAQPAAIVLQRGAAVLAVGMALAVAVLWAIDSSGGAMRVYPQGVVVRLEGEYNQPIYPTLPFIVFAAIGVLATAGWLRTVVNDSHSRKAVPFLAAYLLIALLGERPSIALSDPQHITFWSLPVLVLALFVLSRYRFGTPAHRVLAIAVLVGFMVPVQIYQLSQFVLPILRPAAAAATPSINGPLAGIGAARSSVEGTLTEMVRRGGTDRPYVMYGLDYYSAPIYHRLGLRYPSYETLLTDVTTPAIEQRFTREVRGSNAFVIIARSQLDASASIVHIEPLLNAIARLTGSGMPGSDLIAAVARRNAGVMTPFLEVLRTEYKPVYEANGYVLLSR